MAFSNLQRARRVKNSNKMYESAPITKSLKKMLQFQLICTGADVSPCMLFNFE